jgi:soluble lytic murein transglycosylase-like protein
MTYTSEVLTTASQFKLEPELVLAQVSVESDGNPYAWNPEPVYRYLWNVKQGKPFRPLTPAEILSERPPKDFPCLVGDPDQEFWAQQASWGLMQVMGAVARERGFTESYLTELTVPTLNLSVGCSLLAHLLRWSKNNKIQALAAYNGGKGGNSTPPYRNTSYALKVQSKYHELTGRLFV